MQTVTELGNTKIGGGILESGCNKIPQMTDFLQFAVLHFPGDKICVCQQDTVKKNHCFVTINGNCFLENISLL
jgi:hypothetical protein